MLNNLGGVISQLLEMWNIIAILQAKLETT